MSEADQMLKELRRRVEREMLRMLLVEVIKHGSPEFDEAVRKRFGESA